MAIVKGFETQTVSIEIDKKQALTALAQELGVYKFLKKDMDNTMA